MSTSTHGSVAVRPAPASFPGAEKLLAADTKLSRMLRWHRGETPGPWEIQVHPTNRCNLKCKICWERRAEVEIGPQIYDKGQEISDERFLRLVDEAADLGVREWTIVGGGEPMVRDDLVIAMAKRIRERGMNGAIHTNGTRFKPKHFEQLIATGWEAIRLSLDGPNQSLNDEIRGGGFDKAVTNMKLLREMKEAAGSRYPRVSMHPVITNITYDHLKDLVDLAEELGCESLGVSHLIFEKDDEPGTVFRLNATQKESLPELLQEAITYAEARGLIHNFETLLPHDGPGADYIGKTRAGDGRLSDANCFEVWLTCVIHVDGHAGPCCVSYEEAADNVKDMPLADLWLGPYFQSVRQKIVTRDNLPHYCAGCPTYIDPRSEEVRAGLRDTIGSKWAGWEAMPLGQKMGLAAGRIVGNLREHGLRKTLRRAMEWRQISRG